MEWMHHCDSPLGGMTMTADGRALTGLWFDGQKGFEDMPRGQYRQEMLPVFEETERWLKVYFSGGIPDFTPALNPEGTPFCRAVWSLLLSVPYGHTETYGEIAARLAEGAFSGRSSARAVGGAAARNRILLIIPCHRVVGAGGKLTGYAAGIERKRLLLQLEQEHAPCRNETAQKA